MSKYKYLLLTAVAVFWLAATPVGAQTIVYIPMDDRPVNLDYVVDTAKAAGVDIVAPPATLLGSRNEPGDPDGLWGWLLDHALIADRVVVSADSLLYGNLVLSRTHNIAVNVIEDRLNNFSKLKALNPAMSIYVYSTIMRTPKSGEGGEEPSYYEVYGPSIFRISALRDQAEIRGLKRHEESELRGLLDEVPQAILTDWYARREKNFIANQRLINYAKNDTLTYLLMGRDDCSPYSQSHMESRHLAAETTELPMNRYTSFPGADELGMLMVTRAINNATVRTPKVRVLFAPGAGRDTVPSYEDVAVGQTINAHIFAAGGIPLNSKLADLTLAVNTPEDGVTHEADSTFNRDQFRAAPVALAADAAREAASGHRLAVADIAFANGADNAFMSELRKRGLLFKLESYSGWNTASNTIGYAIGQGMLASKMASVDKNRLLAVRLLDDWAYQANVRGAVGTEVLFPLGGNWSYLDKLTPRLTVETEQRLRAFAATNFPEYPLNNFKLAFPWNRMFEVKIELYEFPKS
ncbi:hypothetical protein SPSIL_049630 [Sporomusa silvacetica DSM 10669]|uniref:DUF4127 family protein n=1 Tax=Sporomusa silvacetica DSM 10669 TaxID=1123289 RepID=A0ABZ3ISP6_9FIRM|nr:DUF4127 family protein [Sporomusa silvacetica]OZC15442.1 hypothetical protein SPSIL_41430 [Sporomusa silvacetica DSM 10669]